MGLHPLELVTAGIPATSSQGSSDYADVCVVVEGDFFARQLRSI